MKTVVVFRFSAMGDVALTMGTLATVIKYNPDLRIIMVTRKRFATFFQNQPQIEVFSCDFEKDYKGIAGLYKLFTVLKAYQPRAIIDLHQNLRTNVLKTFFKVIGTPIYSLDKNRSSKKAIISGKSKSPLPHVSEQYLKVFKSAGLIEGFQKVDKLTPFFKVKSTDAFKTNRCIGIAPFAQHKGKIWPLEKYDSLIQLLENKYPQFFILLFGGGKEEKEAIEQMVAKHKNAISLVGKYSLEEELAIMGNLDVLVSGDTSNMHFGAMMGTPVVSIWGATHTLTGFGPLFQEDENKVEIDLDCRPCSVFGQIPCRRGDYACLNEISPEMVLNTIDKVLKKSQL